MSEEKAPYGGFDRSGPWRNEAEDPARARENALRAENDRLRRDLAASRSQSQSGAASFLAEQVEHRAELGW